MTSIMPAQSVIDVFAGADVPPARLRATQNVHVKHGLEVKSGWRDSNPRPVAAALIPGEFSIVSE